jgi:hypothetical protein
LTSKLAATVSPSLASKLAVGFLVEPQNQGGGGFPGLGLKTGSFGLVIWASKSSQRLLGLGLKIKWASVCWLRHKTDVGRSTRDMCRDIVACFASTGVREVLSLRWSFHALELSKRFFPSFSTAFIEFRPMPVEVKPLILLGLFKVEADPVLESPDQRPEFFSSRRASMVVSWLRTQDVR